MKRRYFLYSCITLILCMSASAHAQWVKLTQFNGTFYNEVYFFDNSLGFITGHTGSVLRTTNSGSTWSTVTLPQASTSANRDICFVSTSDGFISGEDGIWKTTNGGVTWSNITPPNLTSTGSAASWFRNASVGIWGYGNCADSVTTFWRTTDGGSTWTSSTVTSTLDVGVGGMMYSGSTFYAAGSSGKFWASTDDGATWTVSNTGSAGWQEDLRVNAGSFYIASADGTSCVINGNGKILRSTNNGASWTTTSYTGVVMWGVSMYSTTNGWAVGDNGHAFYTTDGGTTWSESSCGLRTNDRLDDVWMIDANRGFAVGDGIYRFAPNEFTGFPDTIDFGNVIIGTTRGDSIALVKATGNSGTVVSRVFAGTDATMFSSTANLSNPLPVPSCGSGATPIRFRPTSLGVKTARIEFTVQGISTPVVIHLKGRGVRPRLIAPHQFTLDTLVCGEEDSDSITISNQGDVALVIDTIKIANFLGNFSLPGITYPITIPPLSSRRIAITGKSIGNIGLLSGRLFIYSNDPDFQDSAYTIDLFMYRKSLALGFQPDTLINIPSAPTDSLSRFCMTIRNSGDLPQRVTQIVGAGFDQTITNETGAPITLAPGEVKQICFRARSSDTIARCRRFLIRVDSCDRQFYVTVCYQAIRGRLVYDRQRVVTGQCGQVVFDTIPILNSGSGPIRIDSARPADVSVTEFTLVSSPFPTQLASGATARLIVAWQTPQKRGLSTARILVYTGEGIDTIRIDGRVTGPELRLTKRTFDVGTICPDNLLDLPVPVENVGERAGRISGTRIISPETVELSSLLPDSIRAGATETARLRFTKLVTGPFAFQIELQFEPCDRVDTVWVTGIVATNPILVQPDPILIGQLQLSTSKIDSTVIRNLSDTTITFSPTSTTSNQVTVIWPGSSLLIGPGDSVHVLVEVKGTVPGQKSARVNYQATGRCLWDSSFAVRWDVLSGDPYITGDSAFGEVLCSGDPLSDFWIHNPDSSVWHIDQITSSPGSRFFISRPIDSTIVPHDSIRLTIQYQPLLNGDDSGTFSIRLIDGSGGSTTIELAVTGSFRSSAISFRSSPAGALIDSILVPPLFACQSVRDTMLIVRNSGSLNDTIDLISSSPGDVTIPGPGMIVLPAGTDSSIALRISPVGAGRFESVISFRSRICGESGSVPVQGIVVDSLLSVQNFAQIDSLCIQDAIPLEIGLSNLIDRDIRIDSVTLSDLDDLRLIVSQPLIVQPGRTSPIRMLPTGRTPGQMAGTVTLHISDPCQEDIVIPVSLHTYECPRPDVVISVPDMTGRWGFGIDVPILVEGTYLNRLEGVRVSIRANPRLLDYLVSAEFPTYSPRDDWDLSDVSFNNMTGRLEFTLSNIAEPTEIADGSRRMDTVATLRYYVLRGNATYTPLDVAVEQLAEGNAVAQDGSFTLSDYCDAYGRLLEVTGFLRLAPLRPNPASDHTVVEYELPFEGPVELLLHDVGGQEVRTYVKEALPAGTRRQELDLSGIASGAYLLELKVGLQRLTQWIIISQ